MKGTQISNTRRQTKLSMGGSRDGCNGTRHSAIEHFCMESEAYKIREGWATGEDDAVFPTNAARWNDKFTFVQVIKACASLGRLEDARLVHKQLIQSGYKSDVFVCNSLVDMYVQCGSIDEAWIVFEKMPSQNVVTWTTMKLGRVQ
jgi:pentatricopeptide repeat protein